MVEVTIGTNTNRTKILVNPENTIRSVLEENNIDYGVGGVHLDGISIPTSDLDKTFTEKGITEKCMLIVVAKATGGLA